MTQYKDYVYADTERLNFANKRNKEAAAIAEAQKEEREKVLRERLEKGEISQAEYKTLSPTTEEDAKAKFNPGLDSLKAEAQVEDELIQELTDEDQRYLSLK